MRDIVWDMLNCKAAFQHLLGYYSTRVPGTTVHQVIIPVLELLSRATVQYCREQLVGLSACEKYLQYFTILQVGQGWGIRVFSP